MDHLKDLLFQAASELFYLNGYKKTNISQITQKAGISVGSFYKYYTSKEQIFLEIFLEENMKLKRSFTSIELPDDPAQAILKILMANNEGINSNPILMEWHNKELFTKLENEFYKQGGSKKIEDLMKEDTLELIHLWKSEGKIRTDFTDEFIAAIFNAIPYIELHKTDIGIEHFPELMYVITEFIMDGLKEIESKVKQLSE